MYIKMQQSWGAGGKYTTAALSFVLLHSRTPRSRAEITICCYKISLPSCMYRLFLFLFFIFSRRNFSLCLSKSPLLSMTVSWDLGGPGHPHRSQWSKGAATKGSIWFCRAMLGTQKSIWRDSGGDNLPSQPSPSLTASAIKTHVLCLVGVMPPGMVMQSSERSVPPLSPQGASLPRKAVAPHPLLASTQSLGCADPFWAAACASSILTFLPAFRNQRTSPYQSPK